MRSKVAKETRQCPALIQSTPWGLKDSVLSSCGPGHPDLSTWTKDSIPLGAPTSSIYTCHQAHLFLYPLHFKGSSTLFLVFTRFHSHTHFQYIKGRGGDKIKYFMRKMAEDIAVTVTTFQCHSICIVPSN